MPKIKGMERERELKPIYILINSGGAKCSEKEVCGTLKRHKAQAGIRSGLYKPDADPPIGGPRIWSCQMNALCIWNEQDVPPFGQLIATETATAVRCLSACTSASASMVHLSNPGFSSSSESPGAAGLPDLPGHRGRRPELSTTH